MVKDVVIIGAGSVGGHVAYNIDDYLKGYRILGFLDDDPEKIHKEIFNYPVLGNIEYFFKLPQSVSVIIGIAFPAIKKKIVSHLKSKGDVNYPKLVSNYAWISNMVKLGIGTIIYPGVTINYGSNVGDFVVMNMNCAIGHDSTIGSYTSLAPGVSLGGHTYIESGVDMGIGSSTIQSVHIGRNSIIGGQSMIIQNVEPGKTVVGVPGKEK